MKTAKLNSIAGIISLTLLNGCGDTELSSTPSSVEQLNHQQIQNSLEPSTNKPLTEFDCSWGLDVNILFGFGGFTCTNGRQRFSVAYPSVSAGSAITMSAFKLVCNKTPTKSLFFAITPSKGTIVASRADYELLFSSDGASCQVNSDADYDRFGIAWGLMFLKSGIVFRWPDLQQDSTLVQKGKQEGEIRPYPSVPADYVYKFDCYWGLSGGVIAGAGGFTCSNQEVRFSAAFASISIGGNLEGYFFTLMCNQIPKSGFMISITPSKSTLVAGRAPAEWLSIDGYSKCKVVSDAGYERFGIAMQMPLLKMGPVIRWPDKNQ